VWKVRLRTVYFNSILYFIFTLSCILHRALKSTKIWPASHCKIYSCSVYFKFTLKRSCFLSQSNFEQLFEDHTLLMCKSDKQTDSVTLTDVITIQCTVRVVQYDCSVRHCLSKLLMKYNSPWSAASLYNDHFNQHIGLGRMDDLCSFLVIIYVA